MKSLFRNLLLNIGALWITSQIFPALIVSGGIKGLVIAALAFMAANIVLVPLLKLLLLPLNLLTLGIFAWLANVLALFFLTTVVPYLRLEEYRFPGVALDGFVVPELNLTTFQVAIIASFIIGLIIHFSRWLIK